MASDLTFLALAGDGIGPEIMDVTLDVLEAVEPLLSRPVELQRADVGFVALDGSGTTIPQDVVKTARAADGVILGPVSHNAYPPREEGGLKLRLFEAAVAGDLAALGAHGEDRARPDRARDR